MCSWIMEDNVLPQEMYVRIKLKSRVGSHIRHPEEGKECQQERSSIEGGSSKMLQVFDMRAKVLRSKMPRGVGLKKESMEMLLMYAKIRWCEKTCKSHLYCLAANLRENR